MRRSNIKLERKQLSLKLALIKRAIPSETPSHGWIRAIREVLGMSARQLGQRIGLQQTHLTRIEQGEVRGTTSLNTLKKVAHGLGCELVYALVPRESLEKFLEKQVEDVATAMIRRTANTMELEDQKTSEHHQREKIKELKKQLIDELPRNLWDYK